MPSTFKGVDLVDGWWPWSAAESVVRNPLCSSDVPAGEWLGVFFA